MYKDPLIVWGSKKKHDIVLNCNLLVYCYCIIPKANYWKC